MAPARLVLRGGARNSIRGKSDPSTQKPPFTRAPRAADCHGGLFVFAKVERRAQSHRSLQGSVNSVSEKIVGPYMALERALKRRRA